MDHPELEVRRHPRRAVGAGVVTLVVVLVEVALEELLEPLPGSVLAGFRHPVGRIPQRLVEHLLHALVALGADPVDLPGRPDRVVPSVRTPSPAVRREHLVGISRPVLDRPRRHGVRRAGRDPLHPVGKRVDDGVVALVSVGGEVTRDVQLVGVHLAEHLRHDRWCGTDPDAQPAIHRVVQRAQVGGQPGPSRRPGVVPERLVQDEQAEHRPGPGRLAQCGVVAQPEVPAEPHDRGHSTTLRGGV